MKGIHGHMRVAISCGALHTPTTYETPSDGMTPNKSTMIVIERDRDERTPLLKDGSKGYGGITMSNTISEGYGSQTAFDSSYGSETDGYSIKGSVGEKIKSTSPNLAKTTCDCYTFVQIMTFVLLLASACFIAIYLLINESRFPPTKYSLDLVHRDMWSNVATPPADFLNHTKVVNIVITQTGGPSCDKFNKCLRILRDLQKKYQGGQRSGQEIPFNFLIGDNQQTYEARGWKYESGLPFVVQNASLVVALIGNYTTLAPSAVQIRSILSLITESVRLKKLQKHYKIYGLQNMTSSENDGQSLLSTIKKLKNFGGLVQVH